ncbi:MAG: DUF2238 domain-containing protein [Fibrobacteres bacterium]|nr:DUF2238 domain-containing protein [Fibrobacterota bacterium]
MEKSNWYPKAVLAAALAILCGSLYFSRDRFTWILEVFPILIGMPILIITYKRFQFTNWTYSFLLLHSLILATGGVYTYAEVPLGYWMQEWFGFARNHYDRLGHFAQGFIPALLTRELIIRTSPLKQGRWLTFSVLSICVAISAFYELIEAGTAISMGATADSFLGSQGDIWDAQWDMFFATIGAATYLAFFARFQDRFIKAITEKKA